MGSRLAKLIRRRPRVYRGRGGGRRLASPFDPLPEIPVVVEYVDIVSIPKVDRRLRRGERLRPRDVLGRFGDPKFFHVAKVRRRIGNRSILRTVSAWDIVFRCNRLGDCRIVSLELHGVRGWNSSDPELVELPKYFDFATGKLVESRTRKRYRHS